MIHQTFRPIEKESKTPLYLQLSESLLSMIKSGQPGDKLPTERALAETYQVSRATVRQAILDLEMDGHLQRFHGRGTFIAPQTINQQLVKFYSFTSEMKELGKVPTSEVISFEISPCNQKIANKMSLPLSEKVYRIVRLRLADSVPMMIDTTYLPLARFQNLKQSEVEKRPLYDILTEDYNAILSHAKERFCPVPTNSWESQLLKVDREVPSLKIERFTWDNDELLEYTISIARGDQFQYEVLLKS
ncbi:MAG: GntR family transcriptional regulator [Negativicutes bacterium]|nr:GntR family transcriptional regulator [Negativicutes bacterium]